MRHTLISDFRFYVLHFLLHETKTAGLNEAQIHSLTADSTYEPAMI